MSDPIHNREDERIALAVLLKDPNVINDLSQLDLKPVIFYLPIHQALFTAIISTYNESGKVDSFIVSSKLKAIGVTHIEGIDIFRYINECLLEITINKEFYKSYFENVLKSYHLRILYDKLKDGWQKIKNERHKPLDQIERQIESLAYDISTISVQDTEEELVDFYGGLQQDIEEAANNPDTQGLFSPFPIFNRWFGMFKFSNVYAFCATSKGGKSTFLNFLANHFVQSGGGKTHVLYCDTEMTARENRQRYMAVQTGINVVDIEDGSYLKDEKSTRAANHVFEKSRQYAGLLHHISCGTKPIKEVESICRRYHRRFIKEGDNLVIVYDYIKMTGEDREGKDEWEIIGEKANALKQLAGSLPNTTIITSVQLNEQGNVSQSARILWFLTNIFKISAKSPDDLLEGRYRFGSHRLEKIRTRFLGREGREADRPVRYMGRDANGREVPKTSQNAINLEFNGFHIEERGTFFEEMQEREKDNQQLTPVKEKNHKYRNLLDKFEKS